MARFLIGYGHNSVMLLTRLVFIALMLMNPVHAGGSFFDAEDQAGMCAATANTVMQSNRCLATRETASGVRECTLWEQAAPCASPITTKDGQKFCPQQKPTSVCATQFAEAEPICELNGVGDDRCDIVTPGQAVGKALEEQLEEAE